MAKLLGPKDRRGQLTDDELKKARCGNFFDDTFYPRQGQNGMSKIAKTFCKRCPVKQRCLEVALFNNEVWGIWGGTTDADRRRLKGTNK